MYGVGKGNEATILYASGGSTAVKDFGIFTTFLKGYSNGKRNDYYTASTFTWTDVVRDIEREMYADNDVNGHSNKKIDIDRLLRKYREFERRSISERSVQNKQDVTEHKYQERNTDSEIAPDVID